MGARIHLFKIYLYQSSRVIDTNYDSFNELVFLLSQKNKNQRELEKDILENEQQLQNEQLSTSKHNRGTNIALRR